MSKSIYKTSCSFFELGDSDSSNVYYKSDRLILNRNQEFSRCFNIVDITIPSNVAEIGASAFEDCKKLSNVKYQAKASVIKEKTFKGCLSLDTISIPEGVTKIAKEAFMNCKKLPSISIPGSLNEIGTGAFKNCAALVDCTLPEGLVRVGKDVFKGCKSLGAESPEATKKQIKTIQKLYDAKVPMFGVALGHQLIAIAKGAKTEKLKYGHRGPNHPVKDLKLDRVHITSQNHGYYVSEETLDKSAVEVSHVSLNDGTVEGLRYKDNKVFTIQFYPEDADYIFDEFIKMM